jgi:hypothetical protein
LTLPTLPQFNRFTILKGQCDERGFFAGWQNARYGEPG